MCRRRHSLLTLAEMSYSSTLVTYMAEIEAEAAGEALARLRASRAAYRSSRSKICWTLCLEIPSARLIAESVTPAARATTISR
jgi:hypothetical protein